MSFNNLANGAVAHAADVQQLVDALQGTVGKGQPVSLTALQDAINYALSVKNIDSTNSRAVALYGADGNPLLTVDKNGVQASAYGANALAPVVTTSQAQTLTNKTLGSPILSGAGGITTGELGFSGTTLQVGDGTTNEPVNVGPFAAWTPGLTQSGSLTLTTASGRYTRIGKLFISNATIQINSAGTSGVAITLTGIPIALNNAGGGVVFGSYQRTSGPNYTLAGNFVSSTSLDFWAGAATTGLLGVNPAFAAAAGDQLLITIIAEAL